MVEYTISALTLESLWNARRAKACTKEKSTAIGRCARCRGYVGTCCEKQIAAFFEKKKLELGVEPAVERGPTSVCCECMRDEDAYPQRVARFHKLLAREKFPRTHCCAGTNAELQPKSIRFFTCWKCSIWLAECCPKPPPGKRARCCKCLQDQAREGLWYGENFVPSFAGLSRAVPVTASEHLTAFIAEALANETLCTSRYEAPNETTAAPAPSAGHEPTPSRPPKPKERTMRKKQEEIDEDDETDDGCLLGAEEDNVTVKEYAALKRGTLTKKERALANARAAEIRITRDAALRAARYVLTKQLATLELKGPAAEAIRTFLLSPKAEPVLAAFAGILLMVAPIERVRESESLQELADELQTHAVAQTASLAMDTLVEPFLAEFAKARRGKLAEKSSS